MLGAGGKTPAPSPGGDGGRRSSTAARAPTATNRHSQRAGRYVRRRGRRCPARAAGRGGSTCAPLSLAPHPEERLVPARWVPPCRAATPEDMEAAAAARRQEQRGAAADGGQALSLSGQSYWLDLWLFILFDLALFVVIYLLP